MVTTKDEAIRCIIQGIPYPQHISDIDTSPERAIRFTWRGDRFNVWLPALSVEEVGDGVLIGSNLAILLTHCLRMASLQPITPIAASALT